MQIKRHSGFSMIEVLVALLILAIGLLGVAGVQVVSMQNTVSANLRTQATISAQDMAEKIRANGRSLLSSNELDDWEKRFNQAMGGQAEADVTRAGNVIQVELKWVDRDASVTQSGGAGSPGLGRSQQTFVYRFEV